MDTDTLQLLPEEIKAEQEWLRSLDLKLPASEFLLQQPYASPLSRRSYIVPASWHWQPPPELVSPDALARDLPVLRLAMEKAYIGWDTAIESGWDWEDFFDRWSRKLSSERRWEIPAHEAFASWYRLLDFQPDNHSGPRVAAPRRDFARTVYLAEAPPGSVSLWRNKEGAVGGIDKSDPSQVPWEALLPDLRNGALNKVWAMSHPARYGVWDAVNSEGRWLPTVAATGFESDRLASVKELLGGQGDQLGYRRLSPQVGYLRIPTLSYSLAQEAVKHQTWLPPEGLNVEKLVVDLRGNMGGAASVVFAVLDRLKGWPDAARRVSFSLRWKDSFLVDSLQWGHVQYLLAKVKGPLPTSLRQTVQAMLYRVLLPSDLGCPVSFHEQRSEWSYKQHRFPWQPREGEPRIVILTDAECGSDGEFLVLALALIPGSVVVGTCTAGVGQYARPGYFVLPSSRVGFRLATALSDINGEKSSFDGYGLKMDLLTPQDAPLGEDSLLQLLSLLG